MNTRRITQIILIKYKIWIIIKYQISWKDKKLAVKSLKQILDWNFDKIILANDFLIIQNAKQIVAHAWH